LGPLLITYEVKANAIYETQNGDSDYYKKTFRCWIVTRKNRNCFTSVEYKKPINGWYSERKRSWRRHRTRSKKYTTLVTKVSHRSTRLCVWTYFYPIYWNSAMYRPLRRSRSFKVTDFGNNGKLICTTSY